MPNTNVATRAASIMAQPRQAGSGAGEAAGEILHAGVQIMLRCPCWGVAARPPISGFLQRIADRRQLRLEDAGRGRQAADAAVRRLAVTVPTAQVARLMRGRATSAPRAAWQRRQLASTTGTARPESRITCGSQRMVKTVACHSPSLALKPYCAGSDVCGTWQSLQVATRPWLLCCQVTYCVVITWQFMHVSGSSLR